MLLLALLVRRGVEFVWAAHEYLWRLDKKAMLILRPDGNFRTPMV